MNELSTARTEHHTRSIRWGFGWALWCAILWGAWYESRLARRLPRTEFEPRPSVDAGVLVFQRRADPLVRQAKWKGYRAFVAAGFRRGTRAVASPRELRRLGLIGASPRDLDAFQWAALFRAVRPASVRPEPPLGSPGHRPL